MMLAPSIWQVMIWQQNADLAIHGGISDLLANKIAQNANPLV